ncbi:DUF1656 domain-containing protein [Leclercia pneumoniae]|nr:MULTISPECIES: DUF1656 domain-containing protein [Leclercia]MBS0852927.1 DUF1656 domain-containing protein [Enterobacter sp. JGM127]MEB7499810.1 DUF1656 domain-containing protein [Leclercia pneumoniae]
MANFQLQRNELVKITSLAAGLPLQDLIVGASIYFPPLFKAVIPGFFLWLLVHRLLRDWIYAGEIWHPMLMDLSLFVLCVCLALVILTFW